MNDATANAWARLCERVRNESPRDLSGLGELHDHRAFCGAVAGLPGEPTEEHTAEARALAPDLAGPGWHRLRLPIAIPCPELDRRVRSGEWHDQRDPFVESYADRYFRWTLHRAEPEPGTLPGMGREWVLADDGLDPLLFASPAVALAWADQQERERPNQALWVDRAWATIDAVDAGQDVDPVEAAFAARYVRESARKRKSSRVDLTRIAERLEAA